MHAKFTYKPNYLYSFTIMYIVHIQILTIKFYNNLRHY